MRRLSLCAVLLIFSAAVHATVILPIEFRELVATSSAIVHAHVTDVRSAYVDGRQSIETFVTVAADEYYKGDLGETVTFLVPGGEMGRYRTVFVGAPQFRRGDDVVLFLKNASGRVPYVVGLNQGAFRVMPDASGRRIVTSPIVMAKGTGEAERVVRGDPTRRPLGIEAFRDAVRKVLAEAVRQ
jgi:hypothetical protein